MGNTKIYVFIADKRYVIIVTLFSFQAWTVESRGFNFLIDIMVIK